MQTSSVASRVTVESQASGPVGSTLRESSFGCVRDALKHIASNNTANFANKFTSRTAQFLTVNNGSNVNAAINGTTLTVRSARETPRSRKKLPEVMKIQDFSTIVPIALRKRQELPEMVLEIAVK